MATPDIVGVTGEMWSEAEADASRDGREVLGNIHSHPYETEEWLSECAPTIADHDRYAAYIQGIMTVVLADGKMRTRCRFFAPAPDTTTTILR